MTCLCTRIYGTTCLNEPLMTTTHPNEQEIYGDIPSGRAPLGEQYLDAVRPDHVKQRLKEHARLGTDPTLANPRSRSTGSEDAT